MNTKGFTLIEVAVVIFILGLLGNQLIPMMKISHERKVRALTRTELNETVESIYGFVITHKRLPCPDVNGDYIEDTTTSGCVALTGGVPSATLGLQQRVAYDGKQYQMEIEQKFTKSGSLNKIESYLNKVDWIEIENSPNGLALIKGYGLQDKASYYVIADRLKEDF